MNLRMRLFSSITRRFLFLSFMDVRTRNSLVGDLFDSSTIFPRLTRLFECTAIVISTERRDGAFLYHLAVENKSASRYTAVSLIQGAFPEVAGNLTVKFYKSWPSLCCFVTSGEKEIKEVWGRYAKDQILEIADLKKRKKRNLGDPEITESTPVPKVKKLSSPVSPACPPSSTSLPEVGVGERLRAYLEKEGWPEEYDVEFLLEHYALIDWIAVQLSFHGPVKTKNVFIYGRVEQAYVILHSLRKVLRIHFADASLKSLSGASNQDDLLVVNNFELNKEEEEGDYVNTLCQVLDGEESFCGKSLNQWNKPKRVPVLLLAHSIPKAMREPGPMQSRVIRLPKSN